MLLLNLIWVFVLFFILYLSGYFYSRYILKKCFVDVKYLFIFNVLTGIILHIFFASVLFTKGSTIFIGLIIFFVFHFLHTDKSNNYDIKKHQSFPKIFIVYLFFSTLFFSFQYNSLNKVIFNTLNSDEWFYVSLTDYLMYSGKENTIIDYFSYETNKREIFYHFGELWFTGWIKLMTGKSTVLCFKVFFPSICFALMQYIIYQIICQYNPYRWWAVLAPFILYIVSGIYIFNIHAIGYNEPVLGYFGKKGLLAIPFLIFGIFLCIEKKYFQGLIFIQVSSFINSVWLPSIYLGLLELYLYSFFQKNKLLNRTILKTTWGFLVYWLILYVFLDNYSYKNMVNDNLQKVNIENFIKKIGEWKYVVQFSFMSFIAPIFLSYIYKLHHIKKIMFWFSIFIVSGTLLYALMSNYFDSIQLWCILYIWLGAIFINIFIYNAFALNKIILSMICIVWLIWNSIQHYKKYIPIHETFEHGKISHYFLNITQESAAKKFAFMADTNTINTMYEKNINVYVPFAFIQRYITNYHPVCINIWDIKWSKNIPELFYEKQVFEKSVLNTYQKKYPKKYTTNQIQVNFMKSQKIPFLICPNYYTLSQEMQNIIKKTEPIENSGYVLHHCMY